MYELQLLLLSVQSYCTYRAVDPQLLPVAEFLLSEPRVSNGEDSTTLIFAIFRNEYDVSFW